MNIAESHRITYSPRLTVLAFIMAVGATLAACDPPQAQTGDQTGSDHQAENYPAVVTSDVSQFDDQLGIDLIDDTLPGGVEVGDSDDDFIEQLEFYDSDKDGHTRHGAPVGSADDCNDNDPDHWWDCASCLDIDGDGYGLYCDLGPDDHEEGAYVTVTNSLDTIGDVETGHLTRDISVLDNNGKVLLTDHFWYQQTVDGDEDTFGDHVFTLRLYDEHANQRILLSGKHRFGAEYFSDEEPAIPLYRSLEFSNATTSEYIYDENSNLVSKETFRQAYNTSTYTWDTPYATGALLFTHDSEGRVLSQDEYRYQTPESTIPGYFDPSVPQIGTVIEHERMEFEYDEDDRLVQERSMTDLPGDNQGTIDGVYDYQNVVDYTYDSAGRLIDEYREWSRGSSSAEVTHRTYARDVTGNILTETLVRENTQGGLNDHNFAWDRTYDENGDIVTEHYQEDDYGWWSAVYEYVYDEHGNLLSETRTKTDWSGGLCCGQGGLAGWGGYSNTNTYTYDDRDRMLSEQFEIDRFPIAPNGYTVLGPGDGSTDYSELITYEYHDHTPTNAR